MKRVIIIHGWGADSKSDWFPWLKKELEVRGFEVQVPDMPETETPQIDKWVSQLEKIIGKTDKNTYLIGHSIGTQTALRYLARPGNAMGGTILVAPWFTLMNLEGEDEIAEPWFKTPIDFAMIKKRSSRIVTIFSDNDPVVPFEENTQLFKERLNPEIIIIKNAGHINGEDGFNELPIVLEKLLEISK
ncbi:MAG TPA: alpha/beta fold hydrolase [Candidatus Paceibacterota bacterium]|nr:alpha/beta fold hydrolase [Candidatus Paceibacterota bacterium]